MKIVSIILYIISLLFIVIYGLAELTPNFMLSEFGRLFLLCGSCLFSYFGGILWSKYKKNNKAMKINLWFFFVLYLILLITLTMFDSMWGRNGFGILDLDKEMFNYYLSNSVNIIPFNTIIEYATGLFNSLLDRRTIFLNLFGNIVCLMPLALFIPILFNKIDNSKKFLLTIIGTSVCIELTQLTFGIGSCDIDDVILNTFGAIICYKILNIKDINNLIKNIFLLENNKINKKKLFKVILSIIMVIGALFILFLVSQKNYNDQLDDFVSKRNYKLTIVDETIVCDNALEKFYENELYEYYFDCIKSNNVYAIINDQEKYLVKELLNNNPTDYIVSIDKLESSGLKFIKKEKYTKISIMVNQENVEIKPIIADKELFEFSYGNSIQNNGKTSFQVFIIPKQTGKSKLTLEFKDIVEGKIISIKEYIVRIDENLKVEYEEIY